MGMAMMKAAGIGLGFTLIVLSGCVPPPPPLPVVAVAAPPAVIAAVPVAFVPEPLPPARVIHHHAAAVRPAVHHHAHRYVSHRRVFVSGLPYCGSTMHPCNVEHVAVPIE